MNFIGLIGFTYFNFIKIDPVFVNRCHFEYNFLKKFKLVKTKMNIMNINCYFYFLCSVFKKENLFLIFILNKVILDQITFVIFWLITFINLGKIPFKTLIIQMKEMKFIFLNSK